MPLHEKYATRILLFFGSSVPSGSSEAASTFTVQKALYPEPSAASFGDMVVFNVKLDPFFKERVCLFNLTLLTGVPTVILLRAFTFVPLIFAVIVAFPFFSL